MCAVWQEELLREHLERDQRHMSEEDFLLWQSGLRIVARAALCVAVLVLIMFIIAAGALSSWRPKYPA